MCGLTADDGPDGSARIGLPPEIAKLKLVVRSGPDWLSSSLLQAVVKEVSRMGPALPPGVAEGAAGPGLLEGLHELALEGRSEGLVEIRTSSRSCYAHGRLLAAVSPVLDAHMSGRWGDTESQQPAQGTLTWQFSADVVEAAISFVYRGKCTISLAELRELCILADFKQLLPLLAALERGTGSLSFPAMFALLSAWDAVDTPPVFRRVLASGVSSHFKTASQHLAPGADEELARRFVRGLKDLLALLGDARVRQVHTWLADAENGGDLSTSLEDFVVAVLKAADPQSSSFMFYRAICDIQIPNLLAVRIVDRILDDVGVIGKESGRIQPWVWWLTAGKHRPFSQFWLLYKQARSHCRQEAMRQAQLEAAERGSTASAEDLSTVVLKVDALPPELEHDFARAFASSVVACDRVAARQWEDLLANQNSLALDQSLSLVARLARTPTVINGFSPLAAIKVLLLMLQDLPAVAVRIDGAPRQLEGVYTLEGKAFRKSGLGVVDLELRRFDRKGEAHLPMAWAGVPPAELRKIKAEWRITAMDEQEERPLAVCLDDHDVAERLRGSWWVCGKRGFCIFPSMVLVTERVKPSSAELVLAIVKSWAESGGDLDELARLSAADRNGAPLRHLCTEVLAARAKRRKTRIDDYFTTSSSAGA